MAEGSYKQLYDIKCIILALDLYRGGIQLFFNEFEHYQCSPLYNDVSVLRKLLY